MQHWSVNSTKFVKNDPISHTKWQLIHLINNGLGIDEKLDTKDLSKYWIDIKSELDPYKARAVEYLLWGKQSSLPTNLNFWNWSGKNQI